MTKPKLTQAAREVYEVIESRYWSGKKTNTEDVAKAINKHRATAIIHISLLIQNRLVKRVDEGRNVYYEPETGKQGSRRK